VAVNNDLGLQNTQSTEQSANTLSDDDLFEIDPGPEQNSSSDDELFDIEPVSSNQSFIDQQSKQAQADHQKRLDDIPLVDTGLLGDSIKDLGIGLGQGFNSVAKLVGQGFGLATGNMDNALIRKTNETAKIYESLYSKGMLESKEKLRMDKADKEGFLDQTYAAMAGVLRDPRLIGNFITEQIPMLAATAGGGLAIGGGAKLAGAGVTTQLAARSAGSIGTGIGMQAVSVGGDTYEDIMTSFDKLSDEEALEVIGEMTDAEVAVNAQGIRLQKDGATLEEAKEEIALDLSRKTLLPAAAISLLANKLISNNYLEKKLVGTAIDDLTKPLTTRILKQALKEGLSEGVEEGGGKLVSNLHVDDVDKTRGALDGVGDAFGQGALSFMFGGFAAATGGRRRKPGSTEGEEGTDDRDSEVDDFFGSVDGETDAELDLTLAKPGETIGQLKHRLKNPSEAIGPDGIAAIDAETLSLEGENYLDGRGLETDEDAEARLYPPEPGDIDYVEPVAADSYRLRRALRSSGECQ